jgi:hypothetical protein
MGFLAVFALVMLSGLQANMQFGKLVESIELSESQMYYMYDELKQVVDDIVDSGNESSPDATLWLDEEVSRISTRYKTKIFIAGSAIDEISLLPWNISHRRLKKAYMAHNVAWVDHLEARSQNPKLRQSDAPEIETSWNNFCSEVAKNTPLLTFGRFDTRLTRICTEGSN